MLQCCESQLTDTPEVIYRWSGRSIFYTKYAEAFPSQLSLSHCDLRESMSGLESTQSVVREAMATSSKLDAPRKPKFRSSCDSCSISKVKCDQGLPTCARCVNLGIKCNYSPSRRMGKPPATNRDSSAKTHQQAKTSKKRALVSPPPSSVSSLEQTTFDQGDPSLDSFLDSTDFMQMQWQPSTLSPASNLGDFNDSDNPPLSSHTIDTDSNSLNHPSTQQLLDLGFTGPSFTLIDDCHEAAPMSSTTKDPLISQPCTNPSAFSLDRKDLSSQSQDCASLVGSTLGTLHSLRVNSGTCSAKEPNECANPTFSIEQVLITNKAAMTCMDKTLACPCSHNPHYALTLALLCHKVLVRYEAIIKTPTTTNIPEAPQPPRIESFSATPITVGAYRMDAEDERRLRIQLVVNELRKMKKVLERYEEKYCATANGDNDQKSFIYSALENFLRSDLKEKLKNLVNALQD